MAVLDDQTPVDMNAMLEARRVHRAEGLRGTVTMPGDKSISHRALMFGAIARGTTKIRGLLEGDDVLRTATAMRALGADIEVDSEPGTGASGQDRVWTVTGGAEHALDDAMKETGVPLALYFGNAGTGVRLVMGLVSGLLGSRKTKQAIGVEAGEASPDERVVFSGDQSLRARPMGRILTPLEKMGAITEADDGRLPVTVSAAEPLKAICYELPVASAQVKSAILLAGLFARGETRIIEPIATRDHTENMLRAFGADITQTGDEICLAPVQAFSLEATDIDVPGDPSSAAFAIVAALIVPGSDIMLTNILLNPMRIGLITTLLDMGAEITIHNQREAGGEQVGDIRVRHSALKGVQVPADRAPSMIDEYPILAIAAAFAQGQTHMAGIHEMRVKESDRIAATVAGLEANGVSVTCGDDWMTVTGQPAVRGGGLVNTVHDHRIAMSFLVMGLATDEPVRIDTGAMIDTSFPTFSTLMKKMGAEILSVDM